MKNWRRSTSISKIQIYKTIMFLSLALLLSFWPQKIGSECGPGRFLFEGYTFVNTKIVNDSSAYASYFLSFNDLYQSYGPQEQLREKTNLEEWQERFCGLVELKDLQQIIYRSSVRDLLALSTSVGSENIPVEPALSKNSFALYLKEQKCKETIDYLVFAKRCEPHVISSGGWDSSGKDVEAMKELIKKGKKVFRKTKSHYIRLRYAYQLIRLAHYAKDYELTLKLYDDLLPKIDKTESILNDWILGHKAGALRSSEQIVESAHLFLQIFLRSPDRRESAFRSFYIQTDEQWQACLLRCENDEERAGLYALRATAHESKAVEEMEKIYELSPRNDFLEMLAIKEIKKLEQDFLGLEFNDNRERNKNFHNIPRKKAGDYLTRLLNFVNKVIEEDRGGRKELWLLIRGYLQYLGGDFYAAGQAFENVKEQISNEELKKQLETFQLVLNIHDIETMDEDNENTVFETMISNPLYKEFKSFPDFVNDRISQLYSADGHPGLAFRCHHTMLELKYHPQEDLINDLLLICEKEDRNRLEEAMVIDEGGNNLKYVLMDMKATLKMSQGQLEAALEILRRIPLEERDAWQMNPFYERLYDCVEDCSLPDSTEMFNKEEIISRIFEMEYKAKSDFERGAQYYYDLGIAFFNMSYFGHSWQAMDYFRSGSSGYYDKDQIYPKYGAPFGNMENTNLSKQLELFERARDLAHQSQRLVSKNEKLIARYRELAARATFMAARCERLMYFMSSESEQSYYSRFIPQVPNNYNTNYALLKEEYNDTRFYDQMIRECKYFRAYALK